MLPLRPYLFDAYYNWIIQSDMTPHLVVDMTVPGIEAPLEYAQDNEIVFDLSPDFVDSLVLKSDGLSFRAYFEEGEREVFLPFASLVSLYAAESGRGIEFPEETFPAIEKKSPPKERFKLIKNDALNS